MGELRVYHIKNIFIETIRENITKVLKVVTLFPIIVSKEGDQMLYEVVYKSNLFNILSSMNENNIPIPNHWWVKK